jgi:hypothetical protein
MVSAFAALGFAYLCLAFAALHLSTFLDPQCAAGTSTTTCAEAPLFDSAAEVFLPLAAVVVLFVAVALIYHHLMGRRAVAVAIPVAGAAGNGRRSISGLVMFLLCVSAGTLEVIVFGQAGGAGGGAYYGALGLAALRALPAAATVTFFCGMMFVIVAGGEAAGGTGGVAGDGPIQGLLLSLLTKVAAGAVAALVALMAMALGLQGAK